MSDYSYNPHQGQQSKSTSPFTVSDARAKYYFDLCQQRGIEPINIYEVKSQEEFGEELERVKSFRKPSEKQLNLITEKLNNLKEMGIEVEIPKVLTGGLDGTAGLFIGQLIELEKEYSDIAPMSDAQLRTIVGYYLCPDVAFEDYAISRRIELENGMWRRPTPQEFAEIVKANMKKRDASLFIDKYRGVFYEWQKTRIRPEQAKLIRQLESRFQSNNSKLIETVVTIGGKKIEMKSGRHEAPITEYVALDEMQLLMLSIEDASHLINMMKSELNNKDLYRFGEISDGSQTMEGMRHNSHSAEMAKEEELKDLVRIAYKMEAVAGYKLPELHDAIDEIIVEYDGEWCDKKEIIRNVMLDLVVSESITLAGYSDLFNGNKTALNILMKIEG